MSHHDEAQRAALVVSRDQIRQHESRKHQPVPDPDPPPPTEYPLHLFCTFPGAVTDGTLGPPWYPTFTAAIVQVRAMSKTAATGAGTIVDVLIDGVSVFVDVPLPAIPAGQLYGVPTDPTTDQFNPDQLVQVKVVSAAGATDLVVVLDLARYL